MSSEHQVAHATASVAKSTAHHPRLDFLGPDAATIGLAALSSPTPALASADDGGAMAMLTTTLDGNPSMSFVLNNAVTTAQASPSMQTDDNSDKAVRADIARSEFHVNGGGIRIGILSDSFNLQGGEAADIADGNLPGGVHILQEGTSGHDEGRAMADLIHKIAPDAQIYFYSATGSETGFANGIAALQAAGCQVIVDDVAYLDEPFFQDGGIVQKAVEKAVSQGVSYFTAASNEGSDFYQHGFTPTQTILKGLPGIWTVNNFGSPGASRPFVMLNIPNNTTASIDLQWDQAFASISGGAGATGNLAMALYTASGQLVGTAGMSGNGQNARQLLQFANHTGSTSFRLVILSNSKIPTNMQFKFILYGSGSIQDPNAGIGTGTVAGHELVTDANTVGAVAWSSTTRFGGANTVDPYSSVGTGQILLDAQGNPVTNSASGQKVNFLAPDGSMTSVFAPFSGTSAAAPNAAAVAALMLQANPYLSPAEVTTYLEESAAPAHGVAGSTGAGLIQADRAVQLALDAPHHY